MPVHYIWCSCQDPGEKGRRITRKRICACLVPYAGMGSSYTACCLSVPVRVMLQDSRYVDYPAGWRSCVPIIGSSSKHRALLGNEVHHAGRLHQIFGVLLQHSWVTNAKVFWMTGVLCAGRVTPGVRHAYKCYI